MSRSAVIKILLVVVVLGAVYVAATSEPRVSRSLPAAVAPVTDGINAVKEPEAKVPPVSVVADHLEIPWSMVFLPGGSMLFTERAGAVRLIPVGGTLMEEPVARIAGVKHIGEGGLLGIALHPNFAENNFVYLYYTYSDSGNNTLNRVSRFTFGYGAFSSERIVVDAIPGASNHNGGRLAFGPDGFLYITTGDAQEPSQAQNTQSLAGKILRVTDEGKAAPGNTFENRVYSYGHRNPQGLAWDAEGQLWATEHGRSGVLSGYDELNKIERGRNYGWPVIQGNETAEGMERPVLHSGATKTWAPGGMAFADNALYFAGLRGTALYEVRVSGASVMFSEYFKNEFGRLRDAVWGPDGFLYIATSNRDGRGEPISEDDRILKIDIKQLGK
ncbi:MAG: PQQ-dependent sugar dehydrogenase [Patescibacteria group bacterium]